MDNKEFIEQMIDEFKKKVAGFEKEEQLVDGFSEAINITYESLNSKKNQDNGFYAVDDNLIRKVLESFASRHMQMDEECLCREFVKDEAFSKIAKISNKIGDIAISVSNGENFDKKINREEMASKFNSLLENVMDYNRPQAEKLISETMLDAGYIENPEIETISLRLSHILRRKQEEEEIDY